MIEFAVIAAVFAMLLGVILESGRAWGAANVLNAAARDAARVAAVTPASDRNAAVESRVHATAGSYFSSSDVSVTVNQSTSADGEPLVTVSATGKMNTVFGAAFLGPRIALTRTVTIRDETLAR